MMTYRMAIREVASFLDAGAERGSTRPLFSHMANFIFS